MTLRTHVMVPYTAVADFGFTYVFVSGSTCECLANILMCGISTLLNNKKPLSIVLQIVSNLNDNGYAADAHL